MQMKKNCVFFNIKDAKKGGKSIFSTEFDKMSRVGFIGQHSWCRPNMIIRNTECNVMLCFDITNYLTVKNQTSSLIIWKAYLRLKIIL